MKKNILLFTTILFLFIATTNAANKIESSQDSIHEITIFTIPTLYPLDWESPSVLYKSMLSNYLKTIYIRDKYLIGHLAVQINSPLLEDTIFTGMSSFDSKEKTKLFLKDKIGFGVLGVAMKGKLETKDVLIRNIDIYKKRHKLAFITFRINEVALTRMLKFIQIFSSENENQPAASNYYGGTFWPLYRNEGAGCTAFGLALLAAAEILPDDSKDWQIDVRIPMELIGGEFNNMNKVKFSKIKKTDSWADKDSEYVPFKIYDPSYIYDWIICERTNDKSKYIKVEKDNVPGLYIDCSSVEIDNSKPIFSERPETHLFVKAHKRKMKKLK